ncbi:twin-arginine translocation signal domain-containing protein [Mycolicibacterium lacusdiani]|uniref:twin-arginine translocation signal domain-containing protein n=1 Tax=Mycolicibacterium lacusdiani TaxID=2895283 RepID=UPI003555C25D
MLPSYGPWRPGRPFSDRTQMFLIEIGRRQRLHEHEDHDNSVPAEPIWSLRAVGLFTGRQSLSFTASRRSFVKASAVGGAVLMTSGLGSAEP